MAQSYFFGSHEQHEKSTSRRCSGEKEAFSQHFSSRNVRIQLAFADANNAVKTEKNSANLNSIFLRCFVACCREIIDISYKAIVIGSDTEMLAGLEAQTIDCFFFEYQICHVSSKSYKTIDCG